VLVEGCDIYDHGKRWEGSNARGLFEAVDTEGFVIYNSRLADSDVWYLFDCVRSRNAFFLSNEVSGNLVNLAMFHFEQYPCVVDGCFSTIMRAVPGCLPTRSGLSGRTDSRSTARRWRA